jgi:hypothetical protein
VDGSHGAGPGCGLHPAKVVSPAAVLDCYEISDKLEGVRREVGAVPPTGTSLTIDLDVEFAMLAVLGRHRVVLLVQNR